ncbi:MAG TPA: hypothetical protein VG795_11295 [Acidimicrobiia bacterium]|nr:hypothetical protein [Acidimicrobiia bacterium]
MRGFRVLGAMIALALASAIPAAGAAEQAEPVKSDNVTHVFNDQYFSGTELAASGKYVYTGQMDGGEGADRGAAPEEGGIRIYDVSGKVPKKVGFLHCPGNDNDVEVVEPGLIVVSFATNKCAPQAGNGLMTVDVSNPRKPKILGAVNTGKNHTHTPYPGTSYVYTSGGGLNGGPAAGPAIVDVSDPRAPKVVGKLSTLTTDCHDISFRISKGSKLMFCAGAIGTGEVQIYDVSDPLAPTIVSRIFNPAIQYSHYAVASSDGQYLAIDDEAFAAHECATGQSPTGRVWIYNIENPALPLLVGSYAPPRGGDDTVPVGHLQGWVPTWCLSHGLSWQPGTHNIAVTWFTGGWSLINVDGQLPTEIAHYQAEDSQTYSALWHNGRLYTNDSARGFDAFIVKK